MRPISDFNCVANVLIDVIPNKKVNFTQIVSVDLYR